MSTLQGFLLLQIFIITLQFLVMIEFMKLTSEVNDLTKDVINLKECIKKCQ